MRILALDFGTHTGWACSCYPVLRSGVYDVPKHERIGMCFYVDETPNIGVLSNTAFDPSAGPPATAAGSGRIGDATEGTGRVAGARGTGARDGGVLTLDGG
jgi:hypothetical protein